MPKSEFDVLVPSWHGEGKWQEARRVSAHDADDAAEIGLEQIWGYDGRIDPETSVHVRHVATGEVTKLRVAAEQVMVFTAYDED